MLPPSQMVFFSSDRSSLRSTWGKPCPNRSDEFSEMSFWWKYFDDIQHKYWPTCCFTSISMWRNNTEYQLESKFQFVVHIVYANPNEYQIQIQVQVSRYMFGLELSQMISVIENRWQQKSIAIVQQLEMIKQCSATIWFHTLWNYTTVFNKNQIS